MLAAAAALAPMAAWGRPIQQRQVPWAALSLAAFAAQLHTAFWVRAAHGGMVGIRLKKAESLSPPGPPACGAADVSGGSFSLIFGGARNEYLPQDTYDIEHAEMGRFSLFIVPIGLPNGQEQRYQAVFNRILLGPAPIAQF
jgi:hypothetical protein